jgi:hypothetical protein
MSWAGKQTSPLAEGCGVTESLSAMFSRKTGQMVTVDAWTQPLISLVFSRCEHPSTVANWQLFLGNLSGEAALKISRRPVGPFTQRRPFSWFLGEPQFMTTLRHVGFANRRGGRLPIFSGNLGPAYEEGQVMPAVARRVGEERVAGEARVVLATRSPSFPRVIARLGSYGAVPKRTPCAIPHTTPYPVQSPDALLALPACAGRLFSLAPERLHGKPVWSVALVRGLLKSDVRSTGQRSGDSWGRPGPGVLE